MLEEIIYTFEDQLDNDDNKDNLEIILRHLTRDEFFVLNAISPQMALMDAVEEIENMGGSIFTILDALDRADSNIDREYFKTFYSPFQLYGKLNLQYMKPGIDSLLCMKGADSWNECAFYLKRQFFEDDDKGFWKFIKAQFELDQDEYAELGRYLKKHSENE